MGCLKLTYQTTETPLKVAYRNPSSDKNIAQRFLSTDPLAPKYPYYSPYQFAGNTPIKFIDLDGLEPAESILYWKKYPKLREARDAKWGPQKQIYYTTKGFGGNRDLVPNLVVREDYSEGTSKFEWYNSTRKAWIGFDPHAPIADDVRDFAIGAVALTGVGVGGAVLLESGGAALLRPLFVSSWEDMLAKSSLDALNQLIITGDYKKIDWANVAASGLIKNSMLKNAIASIEDYTIEKGHNKDKKLTAVVVEFIIRQGADEAFNKLPDTAKNAKFVDQLVQEWFKDLSKKYVRKVAKESTGLDDEKGGTPEN